MEKLTAIKDLKLDGEEFIVYGDLIVTGDFDVKDSIVIISGQLCVMENDNAKTEIQGSDIFAESIDLERDFHITDGDIWTMGLVAQDITSDGDIEVREYSQVNDILCKDYIISGNNESGYIKARNIYIDGDSDSLGLKASRDIYLGAKANLNGYTIEANCELLCMGSILLCDGISVG